MKNTGAPGIIQQPISQRVPIGNNASFSVTAAGAPTITYQWQHDLTNLVGATNFTLTLSNVQMTNAGSYTVVAANSYGAVTSAVAILTVTVSPPLITLPPQNLVTNCGDTAVFQVGVSGATPFGYQWLFNAAPIASATNSSLSVSNVTPSLTGQYSVVVTNIYGSVTSAAANLTMVIDSSLLITPLAASGKQGTAFSYTVPAGHSPISFSAQYLPLGLSIDPASGIISGTPLESGIFGVAITAANACTSDTETLVLTLSSSMPAITSSLTVTGTQNSALTYRIRASNTPTSYGALNLPISLTINPTNGTISGTPLYTGDFYSTVWASNYWGVGSAVVDFHINNFTLSGLSIADVTMQYTSPYLVGFQFALRDNNDPTAGNPLAVDPSLLTVTCMEDGVPISSSESDYFITISSPRKSKTFLVLDFTESVASIALNGDSNGNGISDAVDNTVLGAQIFVNSQPAQAQMGVYEFHSEDVNPTNVVLLATVTTNGTKITTNLVTMTTDKNLLDQQIAGIWTNYVRGYPGGSRCWDALYYAITNLGAANGDEYHNIVFVSDGQDDSSFNTISNVVWAATNNDVSIYCVGFGAELNPATLQSITSQTGGRYYTATNPNSLAVQFAQIGTELAGSYYLRWPTLKRSPTTFMPSFSISYQNLTANSPTNPWYAQVVTNDPGPPVVLQTNYITNFIIAYYSPPRTLEIPPLARCV